MTPTKLRQHNGPRTLLLFVGVVACISVINLISAFDNPQFQLRRLSTGTLVHVPQHNDYHHNAIAVNNNDNKNDDKCLKFDDDHYADELDHLISSAKRIFVTMPAKAAGTSLKEFAQQCTNSDYSDNFPNWHDSSEAFLTQSFELPKLIASHSLTDQTLVDLIQHSSRQTLLIHVFRDETDRLISGIKYVVNLEVCRWTHKKVGLSDLNIAKDKRNQCMVDEFALIKMIKKRQQEIGFGNPETLTCRVYDAIDENAPNMAFVHYRQASKLQELLAKHHCPELLKTTGTVETNTATRKEELGDAKSMVG
jgi:ABC-type tungstate transport system permease subunit